MLYNTLSKKTYYMYFNQFNFSFQSSLHILNFTNILLSYKQLHVLIYLILYINILEKFSYIVFSLLISLISLLILGICK